MLRTAREALTNIVAHAGARTARLGLLYEPEAVSLLVQDDGQGFDPTVRMAERPVRAAGDGRPGQRTRRDRGPRFAARLGHEDPGPVPVHARRGATAQSGRGCWWPPTSPRCGLAWPGCWPGPNPVLEIIGEAATAEEAVEACQTLRPEVALVDLGLAAGRTGPGEPVPASPVPVSRRPPGGSPGC